MNRLKIDLFRSELNQAISQAFEGLQKKLVGEQLYGFSLCLGSLGGFVGAYGNSEESLEREVERYQQLGCYVANGSGLAANLRKMLRWNCEDGWTSLHDPYFTKVNDLLSASYNGDPDAFYDNGYTRLVFLESLAALAANDAEGLFGRGPQRKSLTLNLYLGDQSYEMLLGWASQVNSYEVCERLKEELSAATVADKNVTYVTSKKK